MKLLRILMAVGIVLPGLVFSSVAAAVTATPATTTPTSTTTTPTTNTNATPTTTPSDTKPATTAQSPADEAALRDQRILKRKTERNTKLSAAQLKRLPTVCKSAQGKATAAQARINGFQKGRSEVYLQLTTHLTKLVSKLTGKGAGNVSTLQTEIVNLQSQIDVFKTDLTAYSQAVNDLVAMDCVKDPTGFQASLDAAHDLRDKLQLQSTAIKSYIASTIKPTLKSLRDQLADSESKANEKGNDKGKK